MIILDVGIGYDLCGLDCQKNKYSTGTLRCLSHALDPLGFGAWHHECSGLELSWAWEPTENSRARKFCPGTRSYSCVLGRDMAR